MTEKHDERKPQTWTMDVQELYALIIKRMAYTGGGRINKVTAAQVYTALISVDQVPTDEEAMRVLNPMTLFEVATKIDGIIARCGLESYVAGARLSEGKDDEKQEGGEVQANGDTPEEHPGDSVGERN